MNKMKELNVFAIAAAVIAIIGDFVPYYAIPVYSNGVWSRYSVFLFEMELIGIAVLVCAALVIVTSVINKRVPLIITTVLLMLSEVVLICFAFNEGNGICIVDDNEEAVLLQAGYYMAICVEVLSIISIAKGKQYSKSKQ